MTENQGSLLQAKSSPREAAFQHKEIRYLPIPYAQ